MSEIELHGDKKERKKETEGENRFLIQVESH